MRFVSLLLCGLFVLGLVPSVSAQGSHEHGAVDGPRILLQSDIPPDGRALVGHPTHFEYLFLDKENTPIIHRDVHVTVTLNEVVLYKTNSAHDYDGVGGFDIVFPVAGDFEVTVEVPNGGDVLKATYYGHAFPMEAPAEATLQLDAPDSTTAGEPTTFTYSIVDPQGVLIPHSDVRVEVRRVADDFPVLDVHTHTHEDAQSFDYVFEKAGAHEIRFVAYQAFPDKSAAVFIPFVATHKIMVAEGRPAVAAPSPPSVTPALTEAAVEAPMASDYHSYVMGDPVTGQDHQTGPFSQVRTTMATYNVTNDVMVQHINYEARLRGPNGVVFQSKSLHEYDGALTLMSANQAIGTYTWDIKAFRRGWEETKTFSYDVMPVSLPQGAGPQFLDVSGVDALRSGTPGDVGFFAHGPGVVPFMHSEIAFQMRDAAGFPLVSHKIHTHSDGRFSIVVTPSATGDHTLQADLFDIHGSPTPFYYGASVGSPTTYAFSVTEGVPLPASNGTLQEDVEIESEPLPALGSLVPLFAFGALIAVARRRLA